MSQRLSIGTTPCLNCNASTSSKSPFVITSAPPSQPKVVLNDLVRSTVKVLNTLGRANGYSEALLTLLLERQEVIKEIGFPVVLDKLEEIRRQEKKKDFRKLKFQPDKPIINVAVVVCDGDLIEQVETMLKSVVMFSLDANLHLVIVSDKETILTIGQHVIFLKLALTELGYTGFTYELHLEWFPKDGGSPDWKSMFAVCTSQRLFFPTLLKHLDAVIYLDTDLLVLSNLTEIWQIFQSEMGGGKMVGVASNSESPGHYTYGISLPFFGKHGTVICI
ncbi:unnamed protein product [Allacma fusca]|uniref:Uncharacterized protein n=1 Tax=Allacma fusca TaxID=39272 RepID=A0A8J2KQN5_9HEXA|nr:unnamed protein product [Allacma fusca]